MVKCRQISKGLAQILEILADMQVHPRIHNLIVLNQIQVHYTIQIGVAAHRILAQSHLHTRWLFLKTRHILLVIVIAELLGSLLVTSHC